MEANAASTPSVTPMPRVPFGPHMISRLILGANPINGGSHLSRFVDRQMRECFTQERILGLLRQCEALGINTWQSGAGNVDLYLRHRAEGGRLHYLSLAHDDPKDPEQLRRILRAEPVGIAHHGEVTDTLFKAGRIDEVREFCKRLRDTGTQVGISTHMPAVIEHVEEQGWDVDFFMCCVYERHRTREELRALLGAVPIPDREVYLREDPPRMYAAMRATAKPCLAFKILAAGRLCNRPETVEEAFRDALAGMKPTDAVIVGMYPRYEDQPALNAELVRRYGSAGGQEE